MKPYGFESLHVWQRSRRLISEIYLITNTFPHEERYSLTQQIRRAAVSVACNIAEGSSRNSGRDQARFTEISYGSLLEVLNLLIIATDLGFLSQKQEQTFRSEISEIGNMLNKLKSYQTKEYKNQQINSSPNHQ
jgi:four helix bundle protein